MKKALFHIIFVSLIFSSACKKESPEPNGPEASFLKVMQVESNYAARDVIEFHDGSVLVSAVCIPTVSFDAPSLLPALMAKFSPDGNLLWQIEMPERVQFLWHCILHSNGNIVAVGFNSQANSVEVGIVVISPDGEVLSQHGFVNFTSFVGGGEVINGMDITELPNGNIALALPSHQQGNMLNMVRLLIFTPSLAEILDRHYLPDATIKMRTASQVGIRVDAVGDILINGRDNGFNNDTLNYFAFVLKIDGSDFSPVYQQLFHNPAESWPSNLAVSDAGHAVWASAALGQVSPLTWFSIRQQEVYFIGPTASVWKSDGNSANTKRTDFSGYPKNGFISRVIKCSEGGYVLLGTCNINDNQLVPSEYQIMMIKISESLEVEWMQFPNTSSPSVSVDIIETETGYLVSATHLSFGESSKPILFKTDKNGIIK